MTEDEDIDGLAAEHVLGSLDAPERRQVDARRKTDASLAAAIEAWERRLGPLSDRVPGVAPPSHLLDGILSRISAQAVPSKRSAGVIQLPRKTGRQWGLAVGATTLAACVALAIGWFIYMRSDVPATHVAGMDCSRLYKDFWGNFDREKYARLSAEQLAGVSRMALRAYDACQAGDEQDARFLFHRLQRTS
jgi:anti-sigma-K factor RskA